jgi:hypothetical protein
MSEGRKYLEEEQRFEARACRERIHNAPSKKVLYTKPLPLPFLFLKRFGLGG